MIQLPVRRCPACGYIGRTASFLTDDDGPWRPRSLVCPRCGTTVDHVDPRLE